MNFIPPTREKFLEIVKIRKFAGQVITVKEANQIYDLLMRDCALGLMAMNALGGKINSEAPNYKVFEGSFNPQVAKNCLSKLLNVDKSLIDDKKAMDFYLNQFFKK